jgi:ATP-dependent RNA helicase RhlE
MNFKDLNIIVPILNALEEEKYENPTPIQSKAIPVILSKKDVLGSAQTGTGKTAAFAIPILQHLFLDRRQDHQSRRINALIVTPTRELAIQIGESFTTYGRHTGIKNVVIFGGVPQNKQTNALKTKPEVLIATPGRLLDLMNQGYIRLNDIKYFVLDEADRMLDMGFIHDIKKIIEKLPERRQSLYFSATLPPSIVELSRKILRDPVKIEVSPNSSTAETIQQHLYYTNKSTKNDLLLHLLDDEKMDQVLLFSRTKHGSDRIARFLKKKKVDADAIHGDKSQNQRQRALTKFKAGELRVLVATDIAARGIDIDKLQYVINFDIPNIAETYVHRIGRSGRAGEDGMAISICEPEENAFVKEIEKLTKQKINVVEDHPFPQTDKKMTAAEKRLFEKEKQEKKREFFANRNKKQGKPKAKKSFRRR